MGDYFNGDADYEQTKSRLCESVVDGSYYEELAPDRISLPAPTWKDRNVHTTVETMSCDNDVAIAVRPPPQP